MRMYHNQSAYEIIQIRDEKDKTRKGLHKITSGIIIVWIQELDFLQTF